MLFLDELAEFSRAALDALRQPLEEGRVEIMRGQRTIAFPASVTLVAACNRCPCARPPDACTCSEIELARYARRLSGPLLDRIDLVCEVAHVPTLRLVEQPRSTRGERSAAVRDRVLGARRRQLARLSREGALCNAEMDTRLTRRVVPLDRSLASRLLDGTSARPLSGRGVDRVLRVARTIADVDDRETVGASDVEEALGYRLPGSEWLAA